MVDYLREGDMNWQDEQHVRKLIRQQAAPMLLATVLMTIIAWLTWITLALWDLGILGW